MITDARKRELLEESERDRRHCNASTMLGVIPPFYARTCMLARDHAGPHESCSGFQWTSEASEP